MKICPITINELSKEEACELTSEVQVLIFNPVTRRFKIERAGRGSTSKNKHALECLQYFTFNLDEFDVIETVLVENGYKKIFSQRRKNK